MSSCEPRRDAWWALDEERRRSEIAVYRGTHGYGHRLDYPILLACPPLDAPLPGRGVAAGEACRPMALVRCPLCSRVAHRDSCEASAQRDRDMSPTVDVGAMREEIERLRELLENATACAEYRLTCLGRRHVERDAFRAMLVEILASAHPHPVEHPTMAAAWAKARELLAVTP